MEILRAARTLDDGDPLNVPNRWGDRIKDTVLSEPLQDLRIAAAPHGFRSSCGDWAAEETVLPARPA